VAYYLLSTVFMRVRFLSPRLLLRVGLLLALAPFVLLMAFNHPFFDDFRSAAWTHQYGLWGMQSWFYRTQSGRFTSVFFMTALNPVTYGWFEGVRLVSAVVFVMLWASIAFFLRTLLHTVLRASFSWGTAAWTAGLLLALFCNAAPAPFSFLYWFSGVVVYQLTLLNLLIFIALALRAVWGPTRGQWRCALLACGPLVLAVAGNELTLVQAVPLLALLGYILPAAARPKWWLWLLAGLVAGVLMVTAPGNWLRLQATQPTDPLHAYRWLVLGPRTAYSMVLFLMRPMTFLSLLAAAALGIWLGFRHRLEEQNIAAHLSRRQWWVLLLAFGALNTMGFLLFRYLVVGPPFMRARNEILLVMLLSTMVLAWFGVQHPALTSWEPRLRRTVGVGLLLLAGLFGIGRVPDAWYELWSSARTFDAQMEARYALLQSAHRSGQETVTLPPLRVTTGRILLPLAQFVDGNGIEFDIDLDPGCTGIINGVTERFFQVPHVCCDPNAPDITVHK
jgi:hypothetical protein